MNLYSEWEIRQKFVNYRIKFAIYGYFSRYTGKAQKNFICESNSGSDLFFTASKERRRSCCSQSKPLPPPRFCGYGARKRFEKLRRMISRLGRRFSAVRLL